MSMLPPLLVAGSLALGTAVLIGPGPTWVVRWGFLRRVPRAAVVLWQAGAVAALLSIFGVAWLLGGATLRSGGGAIGIAILGVAALLFAGLVAVRLVWALAGVIAATGARRRRHRDLVDLLAAPLPADRTDLLGRLAGLRVLAEARPLAYCLPGLLRSRVVLSAGTLAVLSPQELTAVLAHERAHLRARHDLVLATFDAVHQAFPHAIRSDLPAQQARLLVEMLADDAAVRAAGRAPLARALVALSESVVPESALGVARGSTLIRIQRLAEPGSASTPGSAAAAGLAAAIYLLAAVLVAAPVVALLAAVA